MFFLLIHNALEDFSVQKNFLRPKVYEVAIVFTHCYKTRLHAQKNHIVRKSMKKSHCEHFYNNFAKNEEFEFLAPKRTCQL